MSAFALWRANRREDCRLLCPWAHENSNEVGMTGYRVARMCPIWDPKQNGSGRTRRPGLIQRGRGHTPFNSALVLTFLALVTANGRQKRLYQNRMQSVDLVRPLPTGPERKSVPRRPIEEQTRDTKSGQPHGAWLARLSIPYPAPASLELTGTSVCGPRQREERHNDVTQKKAIRLHAAEPDQ